MIEDPTIIIQLLGASLAGYFLVKAAATIVAYRRQQRFNTQFQ